MRLQSLPGVPYCSMQGIHKPLFRDFRNPARRGHPRYALPYGVDTAIHIHWGVQQNEPYRQSNTAWYRQCAIPCLHFPFHLRRNVYNQYLVFCNSASRPWKYWYKVVTAYPAGPAILRMDTFRTASVRTMSWAACTKDDLNADFFRVPFIIFFRIHPDSPGRSTVWII